MASRPESSLAARIVSFALLVCAPAVAADSIDWANSLTSAAAEAARRNGLVMVVDLPVAASSDGPVGQANDAFELVTLNSQRVKSLARQELVPYKRVVGVPPFVRTTTRREFPHPQQRPVTYFCAPDLTVVHFVVGYVAPDQLEAAANWAVEHYAQTSREVARALPLHRGEKDESENEAANEAGGTDNESRRSLSDWLVIAHMDAIDEEVLESVRASVDSICKSVAYFSKDDQNETRIALTAVARHRPNSVVDSSRRSSKSTLRSNPALRSNLSLVTTDAAHYALTLLPKTHLENIQQHGYELLGNGVCYSSEASRIRSLDELLLKHAGNSTPVICPLLSPQNQVEVVVGPKHLRHFELPKIKRYLRRVEVVPMAHAELSAIQQRRNRPPIKVAELGEVLFAVFDRQGHLSGTICSGEPLPLTIALRLSEVIAKPVGKPKPKIEPKRDNNKSAMRSPRDRVGSPVGAGHKV